MNKSFVSIYMCVYNITYFSELHYYICVHTYVHTHYMSYIYQIQICALNLLRPSHRSERNPRPSSPSLSPRTSPRASGPPAPLSRVKQPPAVCLYRQQWNPSARIQPCGHALAPSPPSTVPPSASAPPPDALASSPPSPATLSPFRHCSALRP